MRRFAIAALVVALTACGDKNTSEPSNSLASVNSAVAGNYSLLTINGGALPYTWPDGMVLTSTSWTLALDGTFKDVVQYSNGFVGHDEGTYVVTGSTVDFTLADGAKFQGTLGGDGKLTIIAAGVSMVFAKF